mgnify:CR=1 FL=1
MARGTVLVWAASSYFCRKRSGVCGGNVDTSQITNGFDAIYQVIAAIVSSIGSIFLLWGLFEWAQSLNAQDGGAQSIAFKRIGSGLVATLAPQIIAVIRTGLPS